MRASIALVLILVAAPAAAQEPQPFAWKGHEQLAGRISDGIVVGQIAAETIANWRSENRRQALTCQAIRTGVALGVNELVKRLVNRERPDGSDRKSFYSMHTSLATVNSGWRVSIGIPLAAAAGYLRLAANKHYLSDVAVGAGAGELSRMVCR